MPRIEMAVGVLLAAAATLGLFDSRWAALPLGIVAAVLFVSGSYEEWLKPHFRVDRRLADWLLRRRWSVRMERVPTLNFRLRLSSASSEQEVVVTREAATYDDAISFTSSLLVPESWEPILERFTEMSRIALLADINIYVTSKDLGYELLMIDGKPTWPPIVMITTMIAQDRTLSQQLVDATAHKVELSVIGVRQIIRKALIPYLTPESTSDTEGSPPE